MASVGALKVRDNLKYKQLYDRSMAKVVSLSNSINRNVKNAEVVQDISGSTFIKPNVTRWCSKFCSVERIVNIASNNVCDCQKKLRQVAFKEIEFDFFEIVHLDYKTNSHRNEYFLK